MKKIFSFFTLVLISVFIQIGCQSSEDLTSPVSEMEKKNGNNNFTSIVPVNTIPGASTCVELVAGQHEVVGNVCIEPVGSNLKITYSINSSGWSITETHLAVVGTPDDFPRTQNGNPKVGNFPYKGTHNNLSTVEYLVPINNLPAQVYVGAHAVVENCEQSASTNLCPDLSIYNQYKAGGPTQQNGNYYYFNNNISLFGNTNTIYSGWCADQDRYIPYQMPETDVKFLCSADDNPEFNCFIETTNYRPQLNKLNHLINNFALGTEIFDENNISLGLIKMQEIQTIIWKLVDEDPIQPNNTQWQPNMDIVNRVFSLLDPTFIPGCDQKIAVFVLKNIDYCTTPSYQTIQPLIIELPVECVPANCGSETAWGFPYNNGPVPNMSAKFGNQWARYFSYLR